MIDELLKIKKALRWESFNVSKADFEAAAMALDKLIESARATKPEASNLDACEEFVGKYKDCGTTVEERILMRTAYMEGCKQKATKPVFEQAAKAALETVLSDYKETQIKNSTIFMAQDALRYLKQETGA